MYFKSPYNWFVCLFLVLLLGLCACTTNQPKSSLPYESTSNNIHPVDGAEILHTAVLLEYHAIPNANKYKVEIVDAGCLDFEKCALQSVTSQSLTAATDDLQLSFGKSYQWRVKAFHNKELLATSPVYKFQILYNEKIDPNLFRHRIVQHDKSKFDKGYVFIDDIGVAIDMTGRPVYCLASKGGRHGFECLDLLPNGNLAYITADFMEVKLNQDTVLHIKQGLVYEGDTCTGFHHSWTLGTKPGNYFVLGSKKGSKRFKKGTLLFETQKKVLQDTLIKGSNGWVMELNRQQEVVWETDISDYMAALAEDYGGNFLINGHMNAIHFDRKTQSVFVSLRDFNRVIQIDYKTKKVTQAYGYEGTVGMLPHASKAFQRQHSAELDPDRNLLVYSNNSGKEADTISSIVLLNLPEKEGEKLNKIWEFKCDFGTKANSWSKAKGDVDVIDDQHYLVSMGTITKTFIVNKKKEVVWEAVHELFKKSSYNKMNKRTKEMKTDTIDGQWHPLLFNYSASWTPSLYPNYFTCNLNITSNKSNLTMYNEGFLENQLHWKVYQNGELVDTGQQLINPKQSHTIAFSSSPDQIAKTIKVELSSAYEPDKYKTYIFNMK